LDSHNTRRWEGELTDDSIFLAEEGGKIEGILVSSIDREKLTGNILSAYMQRNQRGRVIADSLLDEALEHFRQLGLHEAWAGPRYQALEVECPIHLALLDAGFAWEEEKQGEPPQHTYGVILGGSLEGFSLQPEIKERIEKFRKEGITIERVTCEQFRHLRRFDTRGEIESSTVLSEIFEAGTIIGDVTFVALVDDFVVGWLWEVSNHQDEGREMGSVVPEVIPSYQGRGIGKALYHLGTEEVVRQGAKYGITGTGIYDSARFIYRSVGFQYWYTCFNEMSKRLR